MYKKEVLQFFLKNKIYLNQLCIINRKYIYFFLSPRFVKFYYYQIKIFIVLFLGNVYEINYKS